MTNEQEIVLALLRLCTGGSVEDFPRDCECDWSEVLDISASAGIAALVWDGMQKLYDASLFDADVIPQNLMDEWTSWIMSTEQDWRIMKIQADKLASFFSKHNLPMMVLKGYANSLDWPDPSHRTSGDLDIWLFGKSREADEVLRREKHIDVSGAHHHHTIFMLRDRLVENHYDFVDTASHYGNRRYERRLKAMGTLEDAVPCGKFYIPGPNLEAMFNLRHMALHFAIPGCTLRHLMDWGFMALAHKGEIDWNTLIDAAEDVGMKRFLCAVDTICIENLGFDPSCFPTLEREKELADRILNDIMNPEFSELPPRGFISGLFFKYRRWKAAAWKHNIVFKESRIRTFLTQIWAHIVKPATLREPHR